MKSNPLNAVLCLGALCLTACDCGQIEIGPEQDGQAETGDSGHEGDDPGREDSPFIDLPEECVPPTGLWTYFIIDGTDWPRSERIFYESSCDLVWLSSGNRGTDLSFACQDEGGATGYHDVVITADSEINWGALAEMESESMMTLTYVAETSFWASRWFTLKDMDGNLLLASVDAHALLPDIGGESFYGQLRLRDVDGLCGAEAAECGDVVRLAVDVEDGSGSARVFDETASTMLGSFAYSVTVGMAERYLEPWACAGQMPDRWFSMFVNRLP